MLDCVTQFFYKIIRQNVAWYKNNTYICSVIKQQAMNNQEESKIINDTLDLMEKFIGVRFTLCDCFKGLHDNNGGKYFNIKTEYPIYMCKEWSMLERLKAKKVIKNFEHNGYKRIAIYV